MKRRHRDWLNPAYTPIWAALIGSFGMIAVALIGVAGQIAVAVIQRL
jgi:hypothetical protein